MKKLGLGLLLVPLMTSLAYGQASHFDDVNGLWIVKLDGQGQEATALTESYPEIGVRLRLNERVVSLVRQEDTLVLGNNNTGMSDVIGGGTTANNAANTVRLTLQNFNTPDPADDVISGTYFGKALELKRDVRVKKDPIVIRLPGDRPWTRFMDEILIPKTAEDRETYRQFDPAQARAFLRKCQLYVSGYWMYKYMKGANRAEQTAAFESIVRGMDKQRFTPRNIINRSRMRSLIVANLSGKAKLQAALAVSGLSMYFSTGAGGAVRLHLTDNDDSIVYYITDRRRSAKLGLVVMQTPTRPPLASSFGKWLLDFATMPKTDDPHFDRVLLETMVISSSRAANQLSPVGRATYCDYLGVMAIEDQRGAMFNNYDLEWGYNMTNASFCALIVRALSHGETRPGPAQLGSKPELASQVIVDDWGGGPTLRPGEPSYFDVLNGADNVLEGGKKGGNDMQEHGGMNTLKVLTTKWLRAKHPALVARVEKSLAKVVPAAEIAADYDSKVDLFDMMCQNFYDRRMANLNAAERTEVVNAGLALMAAIRANSRDLEAFILANGVKKSTEWAPRASGF
jgi:hypothetical protein